MTAIALTIAGSDSGGGAGIQADLKTFSALGVYGASVITALTAQNTKGVQGWIAAPAEFVAAQITSVTSDLDVDAIKIGMLANAEIVGAIAETLSGLRELPEVPVIVDPVMIAASGDPLIGEDTVEAMREMLLPLADLVTPNLMEAAKFLDEPVAQDEAAMIGQAERLYESGMKAVLLKGGHLPGSEAVDILFDGEMARFTAPKVKTEHTHGTGCTLSSAIAAEMAKGAELAEAVRLAKHYLTDAIKAADDIMIGYGKGPVHHFYRWWDGEWASAEDDN
ncbi:Hydroxymethylpyrimidine/phosphomethylpyrimidine kinase [Methyloligella halotolerans]|uniref:hydroxymethylpyrimidine kinase n=1 Tax=Methyloligella halotolerans TaxID=1177755 RepID=A0A1E2S341_9HYPH|nr:bifunctional hydroxymethylpyrimidine kinase/phosphomethylpyrimidine kinase [Methyloligella halotolerans]ODA68923.1 Hydroxymethylpyrimidine/phosphomethylpyrimidine kinase [Methyloligella halotolerans]